MSPRLSSVLYFLDLPILSFVFPGLTYPQFVFPGLWFWQGRKQKLPEDKYFFTFGKSRRWCLVCTEARSQPRRRVLTACSWQGSPEPLDSKGQQDAGGTQASPLWVPYTPRTFWCDSFPFSPTREGLVSTVNWFTCFFKMCISCTPGWDLYQLHIYEARLKSQSKSDSKILPIDIWDLLLVLPLTAPQSSPRPQILSLTGLQSKAFHWPQGVPTHSSSASGRGRAVQALSSATEPSSSRQLTYLIRVPFPQVTEHWVLEQNHAEMLLEAVATWTVIHFPWSCQRAPSPRHPQILLSDLLLESKTQIAIGFLGRRACSSLLRGQPAEGDKVAIRSPRYEKGGHQLPLCQCTLSWHGKGK